MKQREKQMNKGEIRKKMERNINEMREREKEQMNGGEIRKKMGRNMRKNEIKGNNRWMKKLKKMEKIKMETKEREEKYR